jgi:hypothetical protein
MNNQAKKALENKILDTQVNYSEFGVLTRREFLTIANHQCAEVREVMKSKTIFNRTKYNRMNYAEQQAYEQRLAIKVPCYELQLLGSESYYDITKTEFDYFNSLPSYHQKTIEKNIENFSKLIGTKNSGYNPHNQYEAAAEVTEVKYINKELCVVCNDDWYMTVESFFARFTQLATA